MSDPKQTEQDQSDKLADHVDKTSQEVSVTHDEENKRFEAQVEGQTAVLEYMKVGNTYIFTHTEVPIGLEGRGIGGALAKTGLEYVRDNDLTTAPLCPFVKAYIQRHPEYKPLVKMGG